MPLQPSAVHHCGSRWTAHSYACLSTSTWPERSRVWNILAGLARQWPLSTHSRSFASNRQLGAAERRGVSGKRSGSFRECATNCCRSGPGMRERLLTPRLRTSQIVAIARDDRCSIAPRRSAPRSFFPWPPKPSDRRLHGRWDLCRSQASWRRRFEPRLVGLPDLNGSGEKHLPRGELYPSLMMAHMMPTMCRPAGTGTAFELVEPSSLLARQRVSPQPG